MFAFFLREAGMAGKVLVPIANGTEEIEAVCIVDTLRRAGAEVTVASVGDLKVTASRGVKLVADAKISDCVSQTYNCIALPGGMPGAEHLRDSPELIGMLKKQKQAGRLYAAICASPAVALQPHGLLEGLRATCYPGFRNQLDPAYASNDRVVVDGNCVTSQGPGTAIEFALELVETLIGPDKKREIAAAMLVPTI
jgi:4-methyl-5(b-hydroxyethyl)-thiazole monophosphate biosynthesis